jgi:hypothetical protein
MPSYVIAILAIKEYLAKKGFMGLGHELSTCILLRFHEVLTLLFLNVISHEVKGRKVKIMQQLKKIQVRQICN